MYACVILLIILKNTVLTWNPGFLCSFTFCFVFLCARCLRHWIWIWAVASRQAAMFVGDLESSADFGGFNETRQVAASCTKYCRRIIDLIILLNLVLWGWTWLNVQMPGCGDGCTWISGSSFGCKLFQCACHGLILHMLHVIVYSICIDIYLYMWVCFFFKLGCPPGKRAECPKCDYLQ